MPVKGWVPTSTHPHKSNNNRGKNKNSKLDGEIDSGRHTHNLHGYTTWNENRFPLVSHWKPSPWKNSTKTATRKCLQLQTENFGRPCLKAKHFVTCSIWIDVWAAIGPYVDDISEKRLRSIKRWLVYYLVCCLRMAIFLKISPANKIIWVTEPLLDTFQESYLRSWRSAADCEWCGSGDRLAAVHHTRRRRPSAAATGHFVPRAGRGESRAALVPRRCRAHSAQGRLSQSRRGTAPESGGWFLRKKKGRSVRSDNIRHNLGIQYSLSAMCAAVSGGKFLCTELISHKATVLNPSSFALYKTFLEER